MLDFLRRRLRMRYENWPATAKAARHRGYVTVRPAIATAGAGGYASLTTGAIEVSGGTGANGASGTSGAGGGGSYVKSTVTITWPERR